MRLKEYIDTLQTKGISQAQFAKKADISLPTLTNYLTGKVRPTFKVMEKIRQASGDMVQNRDMFEEWIDRERSKQRLLASSNKPVNDVKNSHLPTAK